MGVELADDLRGWVEAVSGGTVTAASRHLAGASRLAWNIDLADGRPLFLLRDAGRGGGSGRDAAILRALAPTAVPVPAVLGHDEALGAILLERVGGRSDFPAVDHEDEREPTARHLMEVTAALHGLDPTALALGHLARPATPEDHARQLLGQLDEAVAGLGRDPDPLFTHALDWLRRNIPRQVERTSLVHSDMGPGNFLFQEGKVTAVVDWEVAHLGDPMEDLAAISIRDMATPVGDLPTRFEEYERAGGVALDIDRVRYYRVLILTRNAMLLTLGLAHPNPDTDVAQLTMFRMLLVRAAALSLCDALGVARPDAEATVPPDAGSAAGSGPDPAAAVLAGVAAAQLRRQVAPLVVDAVASSRVEGAAAILDHLALVARIGDELAVADDADRAALGARPTDGETAAYLARRAHRQAAVLRPLMGPLADRLPQPLTREGP